MLVLVLVEELYHARHRGDVFIKDSNYFVG